MNLSQAAKQLFSLSRDKRHDVNGQPNQTVSLSGTAIDYVSSIIKNDAAAALLTINKKGNVVAIYAPQLSTDLTGTNVVSIVGNASNKVGEFSLVSMDAKEVTHTVVLLGREAAEQTGLQLKDSIPAKVLEDTDLVGDGQNYLIAIPTVVPLFFGQEPPSGMITGATTMDQFEMLGSGYAAYQTGMAEAIELVENTSRILNHQTISQDLQRYVANLPPSVTAFTSVPYVFIENVSSDLFPDQAAKLRPLFLPDSNHVDGISSSRVLSTGAILRTQEDVDKQTQANDDANKTHLRHCGADIDFEACTITNLTNAIMTSGYSDLSKKTGSARASACQILLSSVFTKSKQGSAFDVRTQVSIDVFPATFVTMLLTNTWTTTNVMATHPQQNCITVAHFFPQNSSSESVQSTIKNERERANERNAGQQNQREKATLKILGDLRSEEDMLKTIVNMLATVRAFVDNEAMEARGRPCVLHTILTSLLAWVQKVIGDLPKWRRDTGHDMKHFPFVLFSIVESMMIKFTEFTNDLGNLNHYKNGSLADLDVSGIVGMLQIFKLARKDIAHKIALTQPHTSVPACAPHSSAQQDPIQHRGLAPAITPTPSPTDTAGGSPEQRSAKKPRIDTPSQGRVTARRNLPRAFDPKTRGWLFPANGKHPRDIIPSSTNICPFFVSRGYACEENCGKQHLANIAHVPRDDMISILDTLLATKAGWVNENQVTRQFGRKYNPVFGPPDDQTAGA
jgi:hypothetical protein